MRPVCGRRSRRARPLVAVGRAVRSPGARPRRARLAAAAQGRTDPGRRGGELLGQHRRAARRPHVRVTSIIDNPDADPHDYEPTPADGRAVATADLVLVNGIGYDTWASKLVDANPATRPDRAVASATSSGAKDGDNPHRWYDPDDVHRGRRPALSPTYQRIDPADAADFATGARDVRDDRHWRRTRAVVGQIRQRVRGDRRSVRREHLRDARAGARARPGDAAGLPAARSARAPTRRPPTSARSTQQIASHAITVYVYNSQNATPDVQAQISRGASRRASR